MRWIRKVTITVFIVSWLSLFMNAQSVSTNHPENVDQSVSQNLPNFYKINDQLYRGGQPKKDGFAELKRLGVATVIDLRGNDENASKEKALVEAAGLRFIDVPLKNWGRPSNQDIDSIVAQINDPKNQPVFIHCKRGSDRTGTVIAVYRITQDGWTDKQANEEAKRFGFGWWQVWMKDFINDYYRDYHRKK